MKVVSKNNLLTLVCSIFVALYLTGVINEGTLTTNLQRAFVMVYLTVSVYILLSFLRKKVSKSLSKSCRVIAAILAILATVMTEETLLPKNYYDTYVDITLLDEMNVNSQGREAWITGILLDKVAVDEEYIELEESGWTRQGNSIYANKDVVDASITLYVPKKKELTIEFGRHAWSGMVEVGYGGRKIIYDLYATKNDLLQVQIPVISEEYNRYKMLAMWIGIGVLYYELFKVLFKLLKKMIRDSGSESAS